MNGVTGDRAAIGQIEIGQEPKLRGLIGGAGDRRDSKTEGAKPTQT